MSASALDTEIITPEPLSCPEAPDDADQDAYQGLAGQIVGAIAPHSETHPVAILAQSLLAFGIAAGRNPSWEVEADQHRTNAFVCLVGRTAKGRKGTSWGHVNRLFAAAVQDWNRHVVSHIPSGEGLVYEVSEENPDHTKNIIFLASEFATIIKQFERQGNTLSPILRDLWEAKDEIWTRAKTQGLRNHATNPLVSLIAHITVEELRRTLSATELANGFGNRVIWLCVERTQCLPFGGNPDTLLLAELAQLLGHRIAFAAEQQKVGMSDDAATLFANRYPILSAGSPTLTGAVLGRAEAQVRRLAMLYALLDGHNTVCTTHLLAALALWDYAAKSVKHIFGDSLGDEHADELLPWLQANPAGLSLEEIRSYVFHRNVKAKKIDRALRFLQSQSLAHRTTHQTAGRTKTVWHHGPPTL
jgi:hypothetical protein